jgi:hypothetical protein
MLADIHQRLFLEIDHEVRLEFVTRGPLACVVFSDKSAAIYIHQLLNHSDTPIEVISLLLKHELLHLRIPPSIIDGRRVQHPPQFWEAEQELCPERTAAWDWIWFNLYDCLKERPQLERIDVRRNWRNVWNRPKAGLRIFLP